MLAGLRAYEPSGMRRVPIVHRFPVLTQEASALSWRSLSITAAGQPRRFAGFPFERLAGTRSTNINTTYCVLKLPSTNMWGSSEQTLRRLHKRWVSVRRTAGEPPIAARTGAREEPVRMVEPHDPDGRPRPPPAPPERGQNQRPRRGPHWDEPDEHGERFKTYE